MKINEILKKKKSDIFQLAIVSLMAGLFLALSGLREGKKFSARGILEIPEIPTVVSVLGMSRVPQRLVDPVELRAVIAGLNSHKWKAGLVPFASHSLSVEVVEESPDNASDALSQLSEVLLQKNDDCLKLLIDKIATRLKLLKEQVSLDQEISKSFVNLLNSRSSDLNRLEEYFITHLYRRTMSEVEFRSIDLDDALSELKNFKYKFSERPIVKQQPVTQAMIIRFVIGVISAFFIMSLVQGIRKLSSS